MKNKVFLINLIIILSIIGNFIPVCISETETWEINQSDTSSSMTMVARNNVISQSFLTPNDADTLEEIQLYFVTAGYESGYIRVGISESLTTNPYNWLDFEERNLNEFFNNGWHSFESFNIDIDPQTTYYIMFKVYGSSNDVVQIYGSCDNPYPHGQGYDYFDSDWIPRDHNDYGFLVRGKKINHQPEIPDKPSGPEEGYIGISYSYSTKSTDQDNDQIIYGWDWDDGSDIEWTDFYNSGATCTQSHSWSNTGSYDIKVIAEDEHGLQSKEWSLVLTVTISAQNQAPYTPSSPAPSDGATNQDINVDVSWTGGDPDTGDTVTYDVYFEAGDSTPDSLVSNDQSETSYDPGILNFETHYYWKIISKDNHGATKEGPVWDFTTEKEPNHAPNPPSNPNPSNHEQNVDINRNLSWSCSDPDGDPLKYHIYFGTSSDPPIVKYNHESTSYDPGTLSYETKYHWKIQAIDSTYKSTTGPLWDFTSIPAPPQPPGPPTDLMCEGKIDPEKITEEHPELSAIYNDQNKNDYAIMYEIEVGTDDEWTVAEMWDTDMMRCNVDEGNRFYKQYNGNCLQPNTTYYWRIRFRDNTYKYGEWSNTAQYTMYIVDKEFKRPHYDMTMNWARLQPDINWYLNPFPEDENLWFINYGYGNIVNYAKEYVRSGIFSEYQGVIGETLIPNGLCAETIICYSYTVPIVDGEGSGHWARISVNGSYNSWLRTKRLAGSRTCIILSANEGAISEYQFPVSEKWLKTYDLGSALTANEKYLSGNFSHDLHYTTAWLDEGKTYTIGIHAYSSLFLEAIGIGDLALKGEGLGDTEFSWLTVKLDWHNPPPSPPIHQKCPDGPQVLSHTNEIKINMNYEIQVNATDADDDNIYYRWYWDDGSTSNWIGPYKSGEIASATHQYDHPGYFFVRVQAKDDSAHGLTSRFSDEIQVNVTRPWGSLNVIKPNQDDSLYGGTTIEIEWDYEGILDENLMIEFYKEENGELTFLENITTEPIQTYDQTYSWYIDPKYQSDNYAILLINLANATISDSLTLYQNQPPNNPYNPTPENESTEVDIFSNISWNCNDPDSGDSLTYDVFFGIDETPDETELVAQKQSDTFYNPGKLDYLTTYYWQIIAYDSHNASSRSSIWHFTTNSQPDLDCDGSISWTDVEPGATVTDEFIVKNIGEANSKLDWEITEWPTWGSWTFTPNSGNDLTPEEGSITVNVEVTAPDEEDTTFLGEIKVVNKENPIDYDIIPVSLSTPISNPQVCFLAGTKITMADGSIKNIEEIRIGDMVKSFGIHSKQPITGFVSKICHHESEEMNDYYLIINHKVRVTPNHPVCMNGDFLPAADAQIGDILGIVQIQSIEKIFDQVPTYSFNVIPFFITNLELSSLQDDQFNGGFGYFADDIPASSEKLFDISEQEPLTPQQINSDMDTPSDTDINQGFL